MVERRRGRLLIPVAALAVLLAIGLYHGHPAKPSSQRDTTMESEDQGRVVIISADTRPLDVPLDPDQPLGFWTISVLHNHLYAKALGARFIFYSLDPLLSDGSARLKVPHTKRFTAMCNHPVDALRTVHFCKVPLTYITLKDEQDAKNVIWIDSDAAFRSPDIPFQRHLDLLSDTKYMGHLNDDPYGAMANTGYMFWGRGSEVDGRPRHSPMDFLEEWWNMKWNARRETFHEQSLLNRLVYGDEESSLADNVIFLRNESQFVLRSEDQMILHYNHFEQHRAKKLLELWHWADYPIDDRVKLNELLQEMDVRQVDPDAMAARMPIRVGGPPADSIEGRKEVEEILAALGPEHAKGEL